MCDIEIFFVNFVSLLKKREIRQFKKKIRALKNKKNLLVIKKLIFSVTMFNFINFNFYLSFNTTLKVLV